MARLDKILEGMRRNPSDVRYQDLLKVCIEYFGELRNTGGSHAVFKMPWSGDPRVNIQNVKGKAKSYQVEQALAAVKRVQIEGKQQLARLRKTRIWRIGSPTPSPTRSMTMAILRRLLNSHRCLGSPKGGATPKTVWWL